uniref:Uncharacterized protein n=1 Tax=Panagrolaimus sp. ES5 TaxID=591445 RepID=A0AC34G038_9BILA
MVYEKRTSDPNDGEKPEDKLEKDTSSNDSDGVEKEPDKGNNSNDGVQIGGDNNDEVNNVSIDVDVKVKALFT